MPVLVIRLQSAPGSTFGRLLADVRDWCHAHQIDPVAFTYPAADVNPDAGYSCPDIAQSAGFVGMGADRLRPHKM